MKKTNKTDRWDAEHYKKHSDTQFHGALDILNKYTFKGNENVLDIGCGDGKLTAIIAKQLPEGKILGIDASPSMINSAQATYKNIKNLTFECISAEEFSTNQKFDLVVSFFAFHWISNQEEVFKNIYNMLNPKGLLVIKTSGGNSPVIEEVFAQEKWQKQFHTEETWHGERTAEDYKNILNGLGFNNIKVTTTNASRFFDNIETFVGYAMAWIPHVTGLDQTKSLELAHDLAKHAEQKMKIKDTAGRIELISPIATIWAQKA